MSAYIGSWLLDHDWAIEVLFWIFLASVIGLVGLAAYGVLHLGRRIYRAAAVRIDARRVARWAEYYANHPANRRKEKP